MPLRDYTKGNRPRSSAAHRQPSSLRIGALAGFLILLMGTALILWHKSQALSIATDKVTLCPVDSQQIPEVVVVLIDTSDPLSAAQRIDTENRLAAVRNSMARFGLIQVYALEQDLKSVATPIIQLCNPGTGADLNQIYQNPQQAKRRWQSFAATLSTQLAQLLDAPQAPISPIMEGIQAAAVRTFHRPDIAHTSKQLIIVSDLLQNVPGRFTMNGGISPFPTFQRTAQFAAVRTDLSGVEVKLMYLTRPTSAVQGGIHIQFWADYLAAQGATVESVERL